MIKEMDGEVDEFWLEQARHSELVFEGGVGGTISGKKAFLNRTQWRKLRKFQRGR